MNVLMAEATNYLGPTRVGSHAYANAFRDAGNDVMWLGTPLYLHTFLRRPLERETAHRVSVWRRGGSSAESGVVEYYPCTLLPVANRPLFRSHFAVSNTLAFTFPPALPVIERHGFASPDLLWLSQSRVSYALMRAVTADRTAYRMSDDWSAFGGIPRELLEAERRIVESVDTVFVTSRLLQQTVRSSRPDAVYLPNGVADAFFVDDSPEPDFLRGLPGPRAVFAGTISPDWVDADILRAVARRLNGGTVVMVGPEFGSRPDPLPDNVVYTGPRPFAEIPTLLRHCDVGIIPFPTSPLTQAASPVKLFEYLATGLPVVATKLNEIETSASPAVLVTAAGEFADAVADLAAGTLEWDAGAAVTYARGHTWSERFNVVTEAMGL